MKRLDRDLIRFQTIDAFAQYAADNGLSIQDSGAKTRFLEAVSAATSKSLDTDTVLYGRGTEAMFGTIVAALGEASLLKQEDVGETYIGEDSDLSPPDYRIVVDGRQLMVEVKNFRQASGQETFRQRTAYLRRLESYSKMTNAEFLMAVFWSGWGLWSLVPVDAFTIDGENASLTMKQAMEANQMYRLGDRAIGTRWPLRFRIEVDETDHEGDTRTVVIRDVSIYSEGRRLSDDDELRIATALIHYGQWHESQRIEQDAASRLTAVEYSIAPEDAPPPRAPDELAIAGFYSSMITRMFRQQTIKDGVVEGLRAKFTPGSFKHLVPANFFARPHALPLFLATIHPKSSAIAAASLNSRTKKSRAGRSKQKKRRR